MASNCRRNDHSAAIRLQYPYRNDRSLQHISVGLSILFPPSPFPSLSLQYWRARPGQAKVTIELYALDERTK
jgi:hypothetical protein